MPPTTVEEVDKTRVPEPAPDDAAPVLPVEEDATEEQAASEEAEEDEESAPASRRGATDFDDLIDPATGKIYGKFDSPADAIRAYKESEKQMGRKSQEASDYRKVLETAGYTFDVAGKPIAPTTAPSQPAEAASATQIAQELPFDHEVTKNADGVGLNFLGMPIVSPEEWEELQDTDYQAYVRTVNQYERQQADRLSDFRRGQQEQKKTALEQERVSIRQVAKDKWDLPDSFMDEVESKVRADVIPTLEPHLRNDPKAFRMAMQLQAAEMMPAYYKKLMEDRESGITDASARSQKVIRSERGAAVETDARQQAKAANGITPDERRMIKELGVTEDAYIKNRNR